MGYKMIISNSITFFGGGEEWALNIAASFNENGHEALIIARPGSILEKECIKRNQDYRVVKMDADIAPVSWYKIGKILKEFKPDIIITLTDRDMALLGFVNYLYRLHIPYVAIHGIDKRFTIPKLLKFIFKKNNAMIFFVSRELMTFMIKNHAWITNYNHDVMNNMVDTEKFSSPDRESCRRKLIADENLDESIPIVLLIGRLSWEKGFLKFFEHMLDMPPNERPNANFILAGDGPDGDKLRSLVNSDDWMKKHIHILGFRTDIPELLRAGDVFIQPSLRDGMSIVILEAMASGIAVMATPSTGSHTMIIPDKTGVLMDSHDYNRMLKELKALLEDKEKISMLGKEAQGFVNNNYSLKIITQKWIDYITSVKK